MCHICVAVVYSRFYCFKLQNFKIKQRKKNLLLSSYPSCLEVAEDSESRKRDELVQNNPEFSSQAMGFVQILQPGKVTIIYFCFPKSRVSLDSCWPRCARSAEGGSNRSHQKRATKQTWHWQGWGMLQIPAVLPQRAEDSLMRSLLS